MVTTSPCLCKILRSLSSHKRIKLSTESQDVAPEGRILRCSLRFQLIAFGVKFQIAVARQWGRERSAPRLYLTNPFHPLGSNHNYKLFFLYMEKHTSYFFHVVRGSVSRYDVYIRTTHLLKILWERSLELSCPTYDTWYSVFTQNTWHLYMRNWWTKEIPVDSFVF